MDKSMREELIQFDVDVAASVERFRTEERYLKYLSIHVEQDNFSKLEGALTENDVKTAFLLSHTLKSDFESFCFGSIAGKMAVVCEKLKNGDSDGVNEIVQSIKEPYSMICRIISEHA